MDLRKDCWIDLIRLSISFLTASGSSIRMIGITVFNLFVIVNTDDRNQSLSFGHRLCLLSCLTSLFTTVIIVVVVPNTESLYLIGHTFYSNTLDLRLVERQGFLN